MTKPVKVAKTTDIPLGEMHSYVVADTEIVVCHTGKGFFALANECSHDSAPISQGMLRGDQLVCPRHGATFDLASGDVTGPPAVVGIDRYELRIEGEDIYVLVD